jgi:hypothetical protein
MATSPVIIPQERPSIVNGCRYQVKVGQGVWKCYTEEELRTEVDTIHKQRVDLFTNPSFLLFIGSVALLITACYLNSHKRYY